MIKEAAAGFGITEDDLTHFLPLGEEVSYPANAWLFQESNPRQWAGIILDGEIQLVRGLHGASRHLARMIPGALISEGAFLEGGAHSNGAYAITPAVVWQISSDRIQELRENRPELFYRIASRIAVGINRRLKVLSSKLYHAGEAPSVMSGFRVEHDSLGQRELSDHVYYGVQTQRAMENFAISGVPVSNFDHLVQGLAMVKKAAALANCELGVLDPPQADAICTACDEILEGKLRENFTVDMFQGGAGTSTNMNANEVIANRGLEIMGHRKGEYKYLHPNDHVNCSQSTNDAYPTALKLSVLLSMKNLVRAMEELKQALEQKADEFSDVLKMGRTENQDAVPMTLGQEFGAYGAMIGSARAAIERSASELLSINMGATAIGTGINSPPGYADLVTEKLAQVTGFDLKRASNLVEATQNAGTFVQMSATLKRAAVQISKICNDLRWMSSGPRCGLNEINLPPM
ncbi:MAG: cyclic nucleotide-binding domain-containing protein, partial [Desulfobacterales bacterium]|nr:cyclic nucleotide-binding domain-containing protein [Desulfobacterales bacterium]